MSGGSFNYAYQHVFQFADDLGIKIDRNEVEDEYGYRDQFSPETVEVLRDIELLARRVASLMKETEYLYSGDTSDESFMDRVMKQEEKWQADNS